LDLGRGLRCGHHGRERGQGAFINSLFRRAGDSVRGKTLEEVAGDVNIAVMCEVCAANVFVTLTAARVVAHTERVLDESNIYEALGALVREHREAQRMSQASLGKRIGLSRASVANIENGRQRIPLHHLYRMAHALGVNAHTLLPNLDGSPSPSVERGINSSMQLSAREQADVAKVLGAIDAAPRRAK
jgi:transcriptional regulator with XRE-family HTH domain